MRSVSRSIPLLAALAASALLVAGPAYAAPAQPPPDPCKAAGATATTVGADGKPCGPRAQGGGSTSSSSSATSSSSAPPSASSSSRPKPPDRPGEGGGIGPGGGRGPDGRPPRGGPPGRPGGHGQDGHGPGPGGYRPDRPGRPPGDRDCADFPTQDAAQSYFSSIGGSPSNNADRLDANHNGTACEDFFDDGDDQGATVTTTGDDGSNATTSGSQVTEVPEGSAQTGGDR